MPTFHPLPNPLPSRERGCLRSVLKIRTNQKKFAFAPESNCCAEEVFFTKSGRLRSESHHSSSKPAIILPKLSTVGETEENRCLT